MYCPEGFETLASVYHRIGTIAWKWSLAQPTIEGQTFPGLNRSTADIALWEAYREWLWRRFVHQTAGNLYVTSPEGILLRLDVFSSNFWAIASPEFPEEPEEQRQLAEEQGDLFYFIRPGTFSIDVTHTPPDADDPEFGAILARLDGWPVCWKPKSGRFDDDELSELLLLPVRELEPSRPPMPVGLGRPKNSAGTIEEIVVNWMRSPRIRTEVPSMKHETLVQEAIVFAQRAFKKTVSRSTMQRYLAPIFEEVDAQK
jgi:hypothetical protein